jgi:hypothetical protein
MIQGHPDNITLNADCAHFVSLQLPAVSTADTCGSSYRNNRRHRLLSFLLLRNGCCQTRVCLPSSRRGPITSSGSYLPGAEGFIFRSAGLSFAHVAKLLCGNGQMLVCLFSRRSIARCNRMPQPSLRTVLKPECAVRRRLQSRILPYIESRGFGDAAQTGDLPGPGVEELPAATDRRPAGTISLHAARTGWPSRVRFRFLRQWPATNRSRRTLLIPSSSDHGPYNNATFSNIRAKARRNWLAVVTSKSCGFRPLSRGARSSLRGPNLPDIGPVPLPRPPRPPPIWRGI